MLKKEASYGIYKPNSGVQMNWHWGYQLISIPGVLWPLCWG